MDEESAFNISIKHQAGPSKQLHLHRRSSDGDDEESNFNTLSQPSPSKGPKTPQRRKDERGKQGKGRPGQYKKDTWSAKGVEQTNGHDSSKRVKMECQEESDSPARRPKKRAAILVGYCGTGYSGMQIQIHDSKTIEGDIFEALVKAGAVSKENSDDHRKVDVQRAARTDTGVHAAGNCISMKMIVDPPIPPGYRDLAAYVNSFLPEQIRMWGFVRTMKSFQARLGCDSRIYEYLLPTYCLLPPASSENLAKQLDKSSPGWREIVGEAGVFADAMPPVEPPKDGEELDPRQRGEFERRRGWRIDEETLKRFRALVAEFRGTHNFHNYTVGKPFQDKTVKRYMISLEVRDPVVVGEIEWVSVQIHGQSFMLHQIRKMVSLAMLACRTGSPPSLVPETFGPRNIAIPKAPPLGLLLEAPQFKTYNDRIKDRPNGMTEDRDPIDLSLYKQEMEDFKLEWIYERLRQDELETHVFHKWIRQTDTAGPDLLPYLNARGIIPAEPPKKPAAEDNIETAQKSSNLDSEDEEIDPEELKRGDLEG